MANDQSSTTRPLLSLTTIYTPPPTCSQIITSSGDLLWQGGMFQTGDVNCFPPSFSQIVGSAYSPGVCPHGWTVEFTLWATASAETAVYCCPSGYRYFRTSNNYNYCRSEVREPVLVYSTASLQFGPLPQNPSVITVTPNAGTPLYVAEDLIQLRWKPTDTAIFSLFAQESSAAASSAAAAGKTIDGTSSAPSPTGDTNGAGGSNQLSVGVIAAIIVSIIAAITIAGLSAWVFILIRRRKMGQGGAQHQIPPQMQEYVVSELPSAMMSPEPKYSPSAKYGPGRSELAASNRSPVELSAGSPTQVGTTSSQQLPPIHWNNDR